MSDDPNPNLPPDRDSQKRPGFWLRLLTWASRPSTIDRRTAFLVCFGYRDARFWADLLITQNRATVRAD